MMELVFAFTDDGIAAAGHEAVLSQRNLSAARIAQMRSDLAKLPPMPRMADRIDIGERFAYLDAVCWLARDGLAGKEPKGASNTSSILPAARWSIGTFRSGWVISGRIGRSRPPECRPARSEKSSSRHRPRRR